METQLSIIRDFSEVSWDEQTKRCSSYVWVHFVLFRCFIAVETCKWLKQPEIGMYIIISSKLPVWISAESQGPKMWHAPKVESSQFC